ncbi:hypothetical protein VI817_006853 [Penicillium citrinum]|nr:hypothetical protein VI817_006853 [Penicillium citrinum]
MGSKVEKKTSEFKATPLNKEPGHSLKSPKSPKAPKTPRTSKTPKSGITDSQVLFLWTCLENSSIMKEGGGSGSNNVSISISRNWVCLD